MDCTRWWFVRGARRGVTMLVLLVLALEATALGADPYKASSGRKAKKDAVRAIPWEHLDPQEIAAVEAVLGDTSVFRRLPTQVIDCDPNLYMYVLDHPEILANIWELLEIDNIVLDPIGNGSFDVDDGAGTKGTVKYLYRSHDTHLIYAEGSYDGPLFTQPVEGTAVLLLKTGYSREPNGRYYITTRLDAFIHLDNAGFDFLAKTFQSLVGRVADYNFVATGTFMQTLSRTAEVNQAGTSRLAHNLAHISPEVRQGFIDVTTNIALRAAHERAQIAAGASDPATATPRITNARVRLVE